MKKFTKFSLIISLLFFIYSCGYTPLYLSESSNFYFSEIKTNTNNLYFNTIKNFLSKYTIDKGQENKYSIEINGYNQRSTIVAQIELFKPINKLSILKIRDKPV